ncbi:MAG: peptidase clostripain [Acidimicrobiales bacterium]|nr:peptidase clostripain [Acidimicrobiales bacterium]
MIRNPLAMARRTSTFVALALALVAASVAVGVGVPSSTAVAHPAARATRALPRHALARRAAAALPEWTYMVYSNSDNNLEPAQLLHLEEMTKARYGGNVKVVVLIDRAVGYYDGPVAGLPITTGAQLVEVQAGKAKLLTDLGEIDMGNGDTLAWFIQEAAARYPARHYALSISDHGAGWVGASVDEGPNASGSRQTIIHLDAMASALARGERAAGLDKLDLLIFDSCLMSEYEVARALAPYASLMVADEEVELSSGFIDEDQINAMDAGATPLALAKNFVDSYATAIAQLSQANQDAMAFSVTDLSGMDRFHRALASLERALIDNMPAVAVALSRARHQVLTYGSLDPGTNPFQTVDLGDLLNHLDPAALPTDVAAARDAVLAALTTVRLYQRVGAANRQAAGLSIYFPADATAAGNALGKYKATVAADDWAPVLDAFYASVASSANGERPTLATGPTFASLNAGGVLLSGTVSDATNAKLAGARGMWGVYGKDGAPTILLAGPATLDAGTRGTIQAPWAFEYMQLTDGKVTLPGTLFLQQQSGTIRGSMPLIYRTAAGRETSAELELTLDSNLRVSYVSLYQLDETGGASQLRPAAGSVLVPRVQVLRSGKFTLEPASSQGVAATAARYATVHVKPGTTFVAALQLTTIDGSTFAQGLQGKVP